MSVGIISAHNLTHFIICWSQLSSFPPWSKPVN